MERAIILGRYATAISMGYLRSIFAWNDGHTHWVAVGYTAFASQCSC
jgi:hypothetical protein